MIDEWAWFLQNWRSRKIFQKRWITGLCESSIPFLQAYEEHEAPKWESYIVSQEHLRASPEEHNTHPEQDKPAGRTYILRGVAQIFLGGVPDDAPISFALY